MVYFSVDIETSGPCPGIHYMMSLGCVGFHPNGEQVGEFYQKLKPIPVSPGSPVMTDYHPDTLEWWKTQPEAWEEATRGARDAGVVMREFSDWVESFPTSKVFTGYPTGFDFTFVYYYLHRFVGKSAFGWSALDIKSYVAGKLNIPYKTAVKKNMPKRWFPQIKHNHIALDDAREQGILFINMLNDTENQNG